MNNLIRPEKCNKNSKVFRKSPESSYFFTFRTKRAAVCLLLEAQRAAVCLPKGAGFSLTWSNFGGNLVFSASCNETLSFQLGLCDFSAQKCQRFQEIAQN